MFLSYAHKDERLREELGKHLASLRRSALIATWDDRRLQAGARVDNEIDHALARADLVLLLISPDFVHSDYCYGREMAQALQRHEAGQAKVVPVILRPVDWKTTPIGGLLALPRDGKPVTTWQRRDDALLNVATGIRQIAEEFHQTARTTARRPYA